MDKEKIENLLKEIFDLIKDKNLTKDELRGLSISILAISAITYLDEKTNKSQVVDIEKSVSENDDSKMIAFESAQVFSELVSKFQNRQITKILNNFLNLKTQ